MLDKFEYVYGSWVKIQLLQKIVMLHIKFNGIANAAMWSQISDPQTFPLPPWTLGVGSKDQNTTFAESGEFAYKSKWNYECSNMVSYILPANPPALGVGGQIVKIHLLQNMVTLHIKLNGIANAASCKHIFCPYTNPQPLGWIKR